MDKIPRIIEKLASRTKFALVLFVLVQLDRLNFMKSINRDKQSSGLLIAMRDAQ